MRNYQLKIVDEMNDDYLADMFSDDCPIYVKPGVYAMSSRKIDALIKEIEESNGQVGFAFSELIDVTKVRKEKGKK